MKIEDLPKISEEKPPPIEELTHMLADGLAKLASHKAFDLYRNRRFRKLINFNQIEKLEQDRIFNELVLAGLVLEMLILEAPDLRVDPEFKEYLHILKDGIPEAHLKELKDLGIERKFIRLWRKLIKMRYEEYQREKGEVRSAAFELESQEAPIDQQKLAEIQALLPLHTVAILSYRHITRGKGKPESPLFKMILRFVEQLFMDVRFSLEGYKRPLWRRLWFKLKARLIRLE